MAITPSLETQAGSRRHTPGVFGVSGCCLISVINQIITICYAGSFSIDGGRAMLVDAMTSPTARNGLPPSCARGDASTGSADGPMRQTTPIGSARPLVSEAMVEKQERARGGLSQRWETVKLAGERKPPRMPTFRAISQPTKQATKRSRFRCTRESSGRSKVIFSPARGRRATVSRSNMN